MAQTSIEALIDSIVREPSEKKREALARDLKQAIRSPPTYSESNPFVDEPTVVEAVAVAADPNPFLGAADDAVVVKQRIFFTNLEDAPLVAAIDHSHTPCFARCKVTVQTTTGPGGEAALQVECNGVPHYHPIRKAMNGGGAVGHTWQTIGRSLSRMPDPNPNGLSEKTKSVIIPLEPQMCPEGFYSGFKERTWTSIHSFLI